MNRKKKSVKEHSMMWNFQLRLTGLCTLATGLIMLVLTVISLFISEGGIRRQEYASFLTNLNSLYQNLEMQTSISHSWIRQAQLNGELLLRITDNGTPLYFQSLAEDPANSALLDLAETTAASQGLNLNNPSSKVLIQHEEFTMKTSAGKTCYGSVAVIPKNGGYITASIVHTLNTMNHRIYLQRLTFLAASCAAILLFFIFFWFFIRWIIKPLKENRQKQMQFVAAASHELRSPLTVIRSNLDAVKTGSMSADSGFWGTLDTESKRMEHLINDMLQLANADNHNWSMHFSEVEPDTLLLDTYEAFETLAQAKGLHWTISLPEEELPRCMWDGERIRQLLSILIDNAFCYTPAGGQVALRLALQKSQLCLYVSDNGPGIPDDQKDAVFERFYCMDSSHKNKAHFGLGLCIAKEIVKLHHGEIKISDTPGGGATFSITFPVG